MSVLFYPTESSLRGECLNRQKISPLDLRVRVSTLFSQCEDIIAKSCSRDLFFDKILFGPRD